MTNAARTICRMAFSLQIRRSHRGPPHRGGSRRGAPSKSGKLLPPAGCLPNSSSADEPCSRLRIEAAIMRAGETLVGVHQDIDRCVLSLSLLDGSSKLLQRAFDALAAQPARNRFDQPPEQSREASAEPEGL